MPLLILLRDILLYPFEAHKETNSFHRLLVFLFKEFPAFLREKPSVWRVLLFPVLLWDTIVKRADVQIERQTPALNREDVEIH